MTSRTKRLHLEELLSTTSQTEPPDEDASACVDASKQQRYGDCGDVHVLTAGAGPGGTPGVLPALSH